MEINNALVKGVRLSSPTSSNSLRLQQVSPQTASSFTLQNVVLETDCYTLSIYSQTLNSWARAGSDRVSLVSRGHRSASAPAMAHCLGS